VEHPPSIWEARLFVVDHPGVAVVAPSYPLSAKARDAALMIFSLVACETRVTFADRGIHSSKFKRAFEASARRLTIQDTGVDLLCAWGFGPCSEQGCWVGFAQPTLRHLSIAYSSCEGFRSGYNSTIGLMTSNKSDPIDCPIIRLHFRNSSSEQMDRISSSAPCLIIKSTIFFAASRDIPDSWTSTLPSL
jgi:hypothetical protein